MEIELNVYLEENQGIKNGKYRMDLKTKYSEIKQLNIPRDRKSNFHTKVIEPYNRSIGIEELIVSMYPNGIPTRRIAGIMKDILGNKLICSPKIWTVFQCNLEALLSLLLI